MQFVSLIFLIFIVISIFLYQVVPGKMRLVLLLLSNIVFYASFGLKSILILTFMCFLSFGFHKLLCKNKSQKLLGIAIAITILPLILSKYLSFFIHKFYSEEAKNNLIFGNAGSFFAIAGISFFTFKMVSFLIETYKNNLDDSISLFHYGIYLSFFPTIIAGPIDRPKDFLEQIDGWKNRPRVSVTEIYNGLLMMTFGYFEKVLIADNLSYVVSYVYADYKTYGGGFLFVITILYTFQIYFDFAGYSYIARGLARTYGFHSMQNFNVPYLSQSIQEFWQRWHISLSSWLKDYIYIPLGGNRKGTARKFLNIMITFTVSGLWLPTGLAFLVWGLLHGSFQVIGALTKPYREKAVKLLHIPKMIQQVVNTCVTFLLVNFAWIFFAAPDGIQSAFGIIKQIFTPTEVWIGPFLQNVSLTNITIMVLLVAMAFCFIDDILRYRHIDPIALYKKGGFVLRACSLYFLLFGIIVFGMYGPGFDASSFIYFSF